MLISNLIGIFFENIDLVFFFIAIVFALIQQASNKEKLPSAEIWFRWITLFPIGITAFYSFVMHAFFGDFTAAAIGWSNSPFQYEVAMANLAIAVIAICAFKASYGFRLATVLAVVCWLGGDATGHIYQIIVTHDFAVGNAGSWFWLDVLLPIVMIVLIVKLRKYRN